MSFGSNPKNDKYGNPIKAGKSSMIKRFQYLKHGERPFELKEVRWQFIWGSQTT